MPGELDTYSSDNCEPSSGRWSAPSVHRIPAEHVSPAVLSPLELPSSSLSSVLTTSLTPPPALLCKPVQSAPWKAKHKIMSDDPLLTPVTPLPFKTPVLSEPSATAQMIEASTGENGRHTCGFSQPAHAEKRSREVFVFLVRVQFFRGVGWG